MDTLDNNLDRLLAAWRTPELGRDLTAAVLARAKAEDDALDGLLARTAPATSLGRDLAPAILAAARADEAAFDRLLETATVPALGRDLAQPIVRAARWAKLRRRASIFAASLSAAAAVLMVSFAINHPPASRGLGSAHKDVASLFSADQRKELSKIDVEPIVADTPVMVHWDTIREMEQLDAQGPSDEELTPSDG